MGAESNQNIYDYVGVIFGMLSPFLHLYLHHQPLLILQL